MLTVFPTTAISEKTFSRVRARVVDGPSVRIMHTGWYHSPSPLERGELTEGGRRFVEGLDRTLKQRGVQPSEPPRGSVAITAEDLWDAAGLQGQHRGYPHLIFRRGDLHGHGVGDLSEFLEDPSVGELDLSSAVRLVTLLRSVTSNVACSFWYFAPHCRDRFWRGAVGDVLELLTGGDYPDGLEQWFPDDLSWVVSSDVDDMWTDVVGPDRLLDAIRADDRLHTR